MSSRPPPSHLAPSAPRTAAAAPRQGGGPRAAGPPNPALFKTRLCENFTRSGRCRYGLACTFAHGEAELRARPRRDPGQRSGRTRLPDGIASVTRGMHGLRVQSAPDSDNDDEYYSSRDWCADNGFEVDDDEYARDLETAGCGWSHD
eukprot:m.262994 g.262994  ORF g.262994 m.262994 type:complete len:147 (+) comp26275_c0_seq1:49-489(+)